MDHMQTAVEGRRHIVTEPITEESAWTSKQFAASRAKWEYQLSDADINELVNVARPHSGRPLESLVREDFPFEGLQPVLERVRQQLNGGLGAFQLRGLPVEELGEDLSTLIFWGVGRHIGDSFVTQNPKGDLFTHIRDIGKHPGDFGVRLYETGAPLEYHTDGPDIVGLLCLVAAKSGGESTIASSMAVYNTMLSEHRELIGLLYKDYPHDLRDQHPPGTPPVRRWPIFDYWEGQLSCRFVPTRIFDASKRDGVEKLSDVEIQAIQTMIDIASRPTHTFDMEIRPGDMQFLQNSVIVHSRRAYEDHPELERRRHLLRLWLNTRNARPIRPDFFDFSRRGIAEQFV